MYEVHINVATIALFFVLLGLAFMKYEEGEKDFAKKLVFWGAVAVMSTEIWLDQCA